MILFLYIVTAALCMVTLLYLFTDCLTRVDRKLSANLPAKDPSDYALTPSSTEWELQYCCRYCREPTNSRQHLSRICSSCGHVGTWMSEMMLNRLTRRIWDGSKWLYQTKFENDKTYTLSVDAPK